MTSKRKSKTEDLLSPHRERQRISHLHSKLPRLGLLWGVEGSVDRVLDRASDAHLLQIALESRAASIQNGDTSVEAALADMFDASWRQARQVDLKTVSLDEFFTLAMERTPWTQTMTSRIVTEICLKLLAARRAYRTCGRKFHTLAIDTGCLIPAIDRFAAALEPGVAAAWLATFITPVEGEQADDEMEAQGDNHNRKSSPRYQKRKTMDREVAPHTPPRLLALASGSGGLGAPRGLRGGLTRRGGLRRGNDQEEMASPSRPSSRQGDVESLMGGIEEMVIDDQAPSASHPQQKPPGWSAI